MYSGIKNAFVDTDVENIAHVPESCIADNRGLNLQKIHLSRLCL